MFNRFMLTLISSRQYPHTSAPYFMPARPVAIIVAAALLGACAKPTSPAATAAAPARLAELTVTNPSAFARPDSAVTLAFADLGVVGTPGALSVWAGAREVPSQLIDSDGNGSLDSLLAMADFAAGEQQQWQVKPIPAAAANRSKCQAHRR